MADPIANNDNLTTLEDDDLTFTATELLSNDSDPDSDPIVISSIDTTTTAGGTIVDNLDGSYTYTPPANFNGTDSFTYAIDDNDSSGDPVTATVDITIEPVNDAPDAQDDAAAGAEDSVISGNVLTNDSDIDGDPLTVTLASGPANGTLVLNPDGSFDYTPNPDFNGADSFTYTADDGQGGSDTATVSITVTPVNDLPVAVDDFDSMTEDDGSKLFDVSANDTPDPDAGALNLVATFAPTVEANGLGIDGDDVTASMSGNQINVLLGADWQQLAIGETLNITINYALFGNGWTFAEASIASLIVTVNGLNDGPVAIDDTAVTDEDTPVVIDVLGNDTDIDASDTLVIDGTPTALNGTVTVNPDGTLTYTPNANFFGPDTITYMISDGNGGTDTGEVAVTVNPINDAPVAVDDIATVDEDSVDNVINVLGNDTDVEGDTLVIEGTPTALNGTVTVNPDGTLNYTPNADFFGLDTITYVVSDGNGGSDTGEVAVTVNPVND
ncbi:MAG TPA: Ig-like domain-containing protein, partial [Xanthobacteraceae bacterium]|nr:Ig-like domain-containing protein [Xanthobacteraceae bacterium]